MRIGKLLRSWPDRRVERLLMILACTVLALIGGMVLFDAPLMDSPVESSCAGVMRPVGDLEAQSCSYECKRIRTR